MKILLLSLGSILVLATILPLIHHEAWWIRIFDFPRTQITVAGIIILVLFLLFNYEGTFAEILILLALIFSIAYQIYSMYPYTAFSAKQVLQSENNNPDRTFSILVANIYIKNRNPEKFLNTVNEYNPDILCILEPDQRWEDQLRVLDDKYPHSIKRPSDDTYGLIFYTKLKPHFSKINYIVEDYIPSVQSVLELKSGDLIEFYCLHPNPPNPKFADDTTERDAELLIVGKKAKESSKPVIVAGDLNDVAWSYTTKLFQKISGLLDPRIGRGFYNTFHAKIPILRFPLDHVFISKSFRLIRLERIPDIGSDHFPIYAELSYEPENRAEQEERDYEADKEDKKEVEEKIDKAE